MHDLEFPSDIQRNKYTMATKKSYKGRTHLSTRHFSIYFVLKHGYYFRVKYRGDRNQKAKVDKMFSTEKRYVTNSCMFVCFTESVASFKSGFAIDNIEKWRCSIMVNYIKDNKNFTPSI